MPGASAESPGGQGLFPPEIEWTRGLVQALSAADQAVGRLAGEGRQLPNPHLLIRPFLRREAVLSSRIEGTQATLGELLAAEAGGGDAAARSPADLREVANYVMALEYGVGRLRELPLSLRLVRELHVRLMEGGRGGDAHPGEFRRVQNWVGPPGCTIEQATFDSDAVTQIVVNLLDNAIKYAREAADKTITVRTKTDGEFTVIEVEDHGPGIPHRQRKKIFEQFYRPAAEATRETAGTGLGLALVKRFAEAHNGFVEIVSAKPTGAIFRVALATRT